VRRFHPAITLCLGLLLCAPSVVSAGGNSGRIPPRIPSADGPNSEPAWVSAESGAKGQQELAQDSLPPRVKSVVEQELREGIYKQYGCIHYGPVAVDRAGPIPSYGTLKDLAQNSKAAIKGTITDIDHGFSFFGPSSLVEVRVDEWLKKKSDRIADQSFIYLVYPVAEFEAGGYRFCKTDTPQWGSEPQVGDEILFFPYRVPVDDARQVFLPDPDHYEVILYRKEKGTLSLPKSLNNDPDVLGVKDLGPLQKRALAHIEKANGSGPFKN
jgi:hypothetical protein